jgi:hypothetical protein
VKREGWRVEGGERRVKGEGWREKRGGRSVRREERRFDITLPDNLNHSIFVVSP